MADKKIKKSIVVVASGGFDPIHAGHIRLLQGAKKLGDELIVVINNDNWLKLKKGYVFMPQKERKEIIEALGCVDRAVLTRHSPKTNDISICVALKELKPDIFANGGDRVKKNIPEVSLCKKIGCSMIFNVGRGGKIQSSTGLVKRYYLKHRK